MAKAKTKAATARDTERVTAYKAFDADFSCRGFKYEVGKTYRHEGKVVVCESGFHACEMPADVWNYYDLTTSRYALVEMSGPIARHDDDSKVAAAEITIKAEVRLPEFIRLATTELVSKANALIPG